MSVYRGTAAHFLSSRHQSRLGPKVANCVTEGLPKNPGNLLHDIHTLEAS